MYVKLFTDAVHSFYVSQLSDLFVIKRQLIQSWLVFVAELLKALLFSTLSEQPSDLENWTPQQSQVPDPDCPTSAAYKCCATCWPVMPQHSDSVPWSECGPFPAWGRNAMNCVSSVCLIRLYINVIQIHETERLVMKCTHCAAKKYELQVSHIKLGSTVAERLPGSTTVQWIHSR